MPKHIAKIRWSREDALLGDGQHSYAHVWDFDGLIQIPASASPHLVPPPLSLEAAVDPEEAFVAAISSCHMLWFLSLATADGWEVDVYEDEAVGTLSRTSDRKLAITEVVLRPRIQFKGGNKPASVDVEALHEKAHARCFIANSIKSQIRIEAEKP
ncbi:MAG: OsmC family protein [Verrucomicrobia bacterium]|nr:OsmC family protein [Verrucomicrobiota bacterium]